MGKPLNEARGMKDLRIGRLAAIAAAGLLAATGPAWGWGRVGHRVAARVAETRLTPAARAVVRELLESGESLADASTWADEHRREMPESAPWHYVNVPITADHYDRRYCPEAGCVVSKIDDFRRVLADPMAPRAERQKALRFLVHLVQDMHQPVHVGDRGDRGGNDLQLQFFGQGTNLHRLWDSGMIERHDPDEAAWYREVNALATPDRAAEWARGWAPGWADESLAAAKNAYQLPGTGRLLKPGDKLGQEYLDAGLPVVRLRLAQAGTRLASVLNGIFP
jgi:nuclease S1